jgi:hypothetical protein
MAWLVPQESATVNCHCQTTPAANGKLVVVVELIESAEE